MFCCCTEEGSILRDRGPLRADLNQDGRGDGSSQLFAQAASKRPADVRLADRVMAPLPNQVVHCRMRIISVSDVYTLDNLPSLRTLVADQSVGFAPANVLTVLPGDFLAPSLLSSLDAGYSMVKMMNQVPVNFVCFGNHDGNDIPYAKLVHRVEEFAGVWLNSNMPGFKPGLPPNTLHCLAGEDGTPGARRIALLGLLMGGGRLESMYHAGAFGGAHKSIVPVPEAVRDLVDECHRLYPNVDEIIPLTHQDIADDRLLSDMGLFSVILGGHDHDQMFEISEETGCGIVKPGMDATHAAIIDFVWLSAEPHARPAVTVHFKAVRDFAADSELAALVDIAHAPLRELESACLYAIPEGEVLSSVRARFQDCSLARKMATAVRECLSCDSVIINSGTVRGNMEHKAGISYADLKRECPFASAIVVVLMPFSVLKEGVRISRQKWWDAEEGSARKESASALQADEGTDIRDHVPTTIRGEEVAEEDLLFRVGVDTYVLGRNPVFREYCQSFPERVPPDDAGRPLLPILVEYFTSRIWTQLIDSASNQAMSSDSSIIEFRRSSADPTLHNSSRATQLSFSDSCHKIFNVFDLDRDGSISAGELQASISSTLGSELSSKFVVQQLLHMVDINSDGYITEPELRQAIRKMALQAA